MTENTFLGQLIKDQSIYYKVNITEYLFLNPKNRRIFNAVKNCIQQNIEPNIVSLPSVDKDIDVRHLASLTNVPSSANFQYYYDILVEEHRQRQLGNICLELNDMVKDKKQSDSVLEYIENKTTEIRQGSSRRKIMPASETILDTMDYIQSRIAMNGELPGIRSGLNNVDGYTLGFQNGLMYVVGGRPSQGKTAAMCTFMYNTSVVNKIPTGCISCESSATQINTRLLSLGSRTSSQVIISTHKADMMSKVTDSCGLIHDAPLYFYDEPNPMIGDVISQCRRMVSVYGVKIIFIDYLQYIECDLKTEWHLKIAEVSKQIKSLTRDLNIPIVVMAQLTRDAENRRPMMKDISGSTQIERDADCIIMIYHDVSDNNTNSWLLVEKNRDGATGDAPVYFHKHFVKFEDRANGNFE